MSLQAAYDELQPAFAKFFLSTVSVRKKKTAAAGARRPPPRPSLTTSAW